jgi:hypothetical protein
VTVPITHELDELDLLINLACQLFSAKRYSVNLSVDTLGLNEFQ